MRQYSIASHPFSRDPFAFPSIHQLSLTSNLKPKPSPHPFHSSDFVTSISSPLGHAAPPSVNAPTMLILPPHNPAANKRKQPQQHPNNILINPSLHPAALRINTTTLLAMHLIKQHSKNAQQNDPKQENNPIQIKRFITPHERQHIHEREYSTEPGDHFRKDPAPIGALVILRVGVEVPAVGYGYPYGYRDLKDSGE